MATDLTGKVCIITGADEGVGFGLVHGFARRGARVVAGLLHPEKPPQFPASVTCVAMDVTKADEVASAVAAAVAQHGRVDVLVNNAGIYPRLPAENMTFAEWRRVCEINLDGSWRCCEAVIPHMKSQRSGVIVNVGSITLRRGAPHLSHYMSTKGGIVGMTRGLARDLGPLGIRVNCIHLGAVRTEGELRLFPDQEARRVDLESKQSLAGRLTPETVEPVFAFFVSDDSADITGQTLTVDRGWIHD